MLKALLIFIASALIATSIVSGADVVGPLIVQFCLDPESVVLTTKSMIIQLADRLNLDEPNKNSECPIEIKDAILELKQLVIDEDNDGPSICSQERINALRNFHIKHIDTGKIAKTLKNFVLAYGHQVARICRRQIDRLVYRDMHKSLNNHDRDLMYKWASDGSIYSRIIPRPSDNYLHFTMPKKLIWNLRNHLNPVKSEKDKIYLQMKNPSIFRELQTRCFRRFKPIYEKVFLPAISLVNLGYSLDDPEYDGEIIEEQPEGLTTQTALEDLYKWYRFMLLCETVKNVHFVGYHHASGDDKVRIISYKKALDLGEHSLGHFQKYDSIRYLNYTPSKQIRKLPNLLVDEQHSLKPLTPSDDDDSSSNSVQIELFGGWSNSRNVNELIWSLNKARFEEKKAELNSSNWS